jgi:pyrroloquinoline quinone biosynthesis protein B
MFAVPGKIALYLERPEAGPSFGSDEGDVVGLKLIDQNSGVFACYAPGCAHIDQRLLDKFSGASALFFDGTLYTDDEMIAQGLSAKTGRRMGHISMSGEDGSMAALTHLDVQRRIYIHLNNSNPVLRDSSPERRAVETAGWVVAEDGMEITL